MNFRLSSIAHEAKRSVMRDLLPLINQPGVISLASGLPAGEVLPQAALQTCIDRVMARDGAKALQYGPPYGPLRELLAAHMSQRGVVCTPDEIFITSGSQQSLELLMRLLVDDGQGVAVEALTFTGILQATRAHRARLTAVPLDYRHGLDLEAFAAALGQAPQAAIVIPDFHNPLGVSLPPATREHLARLVARAGTPLIEDDPYSLLRFDGDPWRPIKAYDADQAVIYCGSFSKILAPSLRLGWMVAPPHLHPKLTVLRESIDLESSQLWQRTAAEFLDAGFLAPHLDRLRALNAERSRALDAALSRHLTGRATWSQPQGGLFAWVELNAAIDTTALLPTAIAQGVAYVPGAAFAAAPDVGAHGLRLNFSNLAPAEIDQAVSTLARVVTGAGGSVTCNGPARPIADHAGVAR